MKQNGNIVIVGMGALGLLFGQRIRESIGDEHLFFLMDEDSRAFRMMIH